MRHADLVEHKAAIECIFGFFCKKKQKQHHYEPLKWCSFIPLHQTSDSRAMCKKKIYIYLCDINEHSPLIAHMDTRREEEENLQLSLTRTHESIRPPPPPPPKALGGCCAAFGSCLAACRLTGNRRSFSLAHPRPSH